MNTRIQTMLAFAIGLVAFSLLSLAPTGVAAAATQSGFLMQKTDGTPEVWQMDSTGHTLGFDFDLPTPNGSGWKIVGVGDFDGDGNPDILWQHTDGTPGIWFLNGPRVVQMVGLSNPGSNWRIVGVGDFNGDGKADILWQATDGSPGIWLMSGSTVIAAAGLGGPSSWQIVGVGDFNADGKSDILWQTTDGSGAGIWLMNGTTPIAEAGLPPPGSGWKAAGTGDFNGDGRSDVVWQYSDGTAMIWFMNGTSNTGQVSIISNTSWKIVAAGDFNGDGKADILWQNPDGTPGIWLMNGTTPTWEGPLKNPGTSWQIITTGAFGAPPALPVQANDGHVQITTVGGIQTVFNHTTDACGPGDADQPDSSGDAFRAADGTVNFTGNSWPANYRMIGRSLDTVQRSCTPTYVSPQDTNFSDSKYREWLGPMSTLDGTTVYGLVHNEWYPPCTNDANNFSLIYAITLVVSTDGGATYSHPSNYKITAPQAWDGTCPAFYGQGFINMITKDGYYYTIDESFVPPDNFGGTCLMRTTNLADASSWQIWISGTNWQPLSTSTPCGALSGLQGNPSHISYSTYLNTYVVATFGVEAGVGYTTSADLFNWSPLQTIVPLSSGAVNGLTILYATLLDPTDTNQNFENIGQQPYLYEVYVKPNGDRDVIRQQIKFTILN